MKINCPDCGKGHTCNYPKLLEVYIYKKTKVEQLKKLKKPNDALKVIKKKVEFNIMN